MIWLVKICSKCGKMISNDAAYCSACGTSQADTSEGESSQTIGGVRFQQLFGSKNLSTLTRKRWLIGIGALVLICFLIGLFSPSPELAVQIIRVDQVTANFGNLQITNLAKQPVTLKHMAINNSESPPCSFDVEQAIIFGKATLQPGDSATIGTFAMMLGSCGTFFNLAIDTDKGSAEYTFGKGHQ